MKDYAILAKRRLASNVCEYTLYAPLVARHCRAGQFVILRVDDEGERVPFTICDYSRESGTIMLLVQEVGYSTCKLAQLREGDALRDIAGPLGNPTDLDAYKKICLVGGGIGSAVIYPQAKNLHAKGYPADVILGARTADLLIFRQQLEQYASRAYFVTDDGSFGAKGFVTDKLKQLLDGGAGYDCVFAVGPLAMMKAVCDLTAEYGVDTIVSMNSMMVDGTGMCGCCRLTLGDRTVYACIDGPEFDGHLVDFDETIKRNRMYREQESKHFCRLRGEYV